MPPFGLVHGRINATSDWVAYAGLWRYWVRRLQVVCGVLVDDVINLEIFWVHQLVYSVRCIGSNLGLGRVTNLVVDLISSWLTLHSHGHDNINGSNKPAFSGGAVVTLGLWCLRSR